jgi:RNA polymerase sigma-70 factor, ECF subfamily
VNDDVATFQAHRPVLLALAYRMMGDVGRAEDIVQEAWLRWQGREVEVETPKAYLLKVVTRLCLNELDSARARHEESRSDRLPEPVDLGGGGLGSSETMDQISMAFLVVLQRLTPGERAVLILHDVLDFSHAEIAELVQKSEPACRQVLRRARANVASERRAMATSREEHGRLLGAFVTAIKAGDVDELTHLLADDAVAISDGGADGASFGGVRNLPGPLECPHKIAVFLASAWRRGGATVELRSCDLNGQPALLGLRDGLPFAAFLISVADGKIRNVYIQADPARLRHVGALN